LALRPAAPARTRLTRAKFAQAAVEHLRIFVKWMMLWVLCLGRKRRYFALRGIITLAAARVSVYERRHLRFLRRVLSAGDTAVDVGASFGAYTAQMSRLVGPTGRVVAFEPIGDVFMVLQRRMDRRSNVTCRQLALSDRDECGVELHIPVLWRSLPEPALATMEDLDARNDKETIDVVRLDSFASELPQLSFVKVDVEGHEHAFLCGARDVIIRDTPLIQLESNDIARDRQAYADFAKSVRYELAYLGADGSLRQLDHDAPQNEYNFYLVPSASE
jgi:FkbM family methyltransferase